jgi:hypothetical protein
MDEAEAAEMVHVWFERVRSFIAEGAWYDARTAAMELDQWMAKAQGAAYEAKLRQN